MKKTVSQSVKDRISKKPELSVFSTADFLDVGTRSSIGSVLSRLNQLGVVERVYSGVYAKPSNRTVYGFKFRAQMDCIVLAIARKEGVVIKTPSLDATNILHLTNCVQARMEYLTTGKSRTIIVRGVKIKLKHMGSKLMQWLDSPALTFMAVQAIYWLGERILKDDDLALRLLNNIDEPARRDLLDNIERLPVWAQRTLEKVAF